MPTLILDRDLEQRLLKQRRAWGADHCDEVWEGVYHMAPSPSDEHQNVATWFAWPFLEVIALSHRGEVRLGINVSDRVDDWQHNFRIPDVSVFLAGGKARNHGAFWHGGPDFLVEIVSPGDETRAKIPFYEKVGVREMLIVDREPWALELLRLDNQSLVLVAKSTVENLVTLSSDVLPLTFRLVSGPDRPKIEVRSAELKRSWTF